MYDMNNFALTTSVPWMKDLSFDTLGGWNLIPKKSSCNLVVSVMGLNLHPPEHHVDSVLLHELVNIKMFTYQGSANYLLHEVVAPRLCLSHPLAPLPGNGK